jgi:hypothetical protein
MEYTATESDGFLEEARRIRAELHGSKQLADPFPDKPDEMEWEDYWPLFQQGTDAESALAGTLQRPKLLPTENHIWEKCEPPIGLFEGLGSPEVKEALSNSPTPVHIDQILKSLDAIEDTDGVLILAGTVVDLATIFLIASHANAEQISEIRSENWLPLDLDKIKQGFVENSTEFKALFHVDIPDFIYELHHYHLTMRDLVGNTSLNLFDAEMNGLESLDYGLFQKVLSGKKPELADAVSLESRHHALNYFPLFARDYDSVTEGLIFDYLENSFSPVIAYDGDGSFGGHKGIWDCLTEASSCEGSDFYWEEEEFTYEGLSELIEDDNKYALAGWFYNLVTTGYLNFHNKPSLRLDAIYQARYDHPYPEFKEMKHSLEDNGFFAASDIHIYPLLPVNLDSNFHLIFSLDRLESLLDTLGSSFCQTSFDSMGIKKFVTREKKHQENILELMGLDTEEWGSKKALSEADIDEFFEALEGFCIQESDAGRPYLAFLIGLHAWACYDKRATKLSAKLLEEVPDNICHPIIRTVAKLHAGARY